MTDRELLLTAQVQVNMAKGQLDLVLAQIAAHLAGTPNPVLPPNPVVPAPTTNPPAHTGSQARPLWERGSFWRVQFSGPGDTHNTTYTVPPGVNYMPGQVQIYGDNAFANGYLDVRVDGVLVGLGEAIPITPGIHLITAVCRDNDATRANGAFANIQIVNQ